MAVSKTKPKARNYTQIGLQQKVDTLKITVGRLEKRVRELETFISALAKVISKQL